MKRINFLISGLLLLITSQILAKPNFIHPVNEYSKGPHYSIELLPGVSYLKYEEFVKNSPFVIDDGFAFGLYGAFTYWDNQYIRLKIDAYIAHAELDYESGSGTMSGEPNDLLEIRGWLGHDFYFKGCRRLTPYLGAGYRRLADNSGGMITDLGAVAYDRRANYYYSPIGIEFRFFHTPDVDLELMAEFDFLWKGYQKSDDIESHYAHVNEQDDGYGFKLKLRALKTLRSNMRLVFEPYYNYWHVEDSSLNCNPYFCVIEPYNKGYEVGVRFGLLYLNG